jgi:hypothetical protein
LADSDAEVLDEFYKPADAPAPGPWLTRDGLACVASALGVSLAGAAELVAARLVISPRRPLRWLHSGFAEAGMGYVFGQAVEDLEAPALKRRSEQVLLRRRTRPLGAEQGQFELSGG